MAKRSYSDREKAEALAILDSNGGNVAKTSRESGIPRKTLGEWRDGRTHPDVADIRQEKKTGFLERWESVLDLTLGLMVEGGGKRLKDLDGDRLARVAGIATDKIANLRESQEGGMEDIDDAETDELKPEQIEAFARIVRAEAA